MKNDTRLTLHALLALAVLALGNKRIYSSFHDNGLLDAINAWTSTLIMSLGLAVFLIVIYPAGIFFSWLFAWLFARWGVTPENTLRGIVLTTVCAALVIELIVVAILNKG